MLRYKIDVLQALREAGYSQSYLIKNKIFGGNTVTYIRHKKPIDWKTLEKICELLRCQPADFLEWVPDE